MIDLQERIAVLEERVSQMDILLNKIDKHVESIDAHFNKQKGVIGAVWFVVSCIGVFLSALRFFHKG